MCEINLFDIPIQNVTLQDAVEQIIASTDQPETTIIQFVNAHCVNISRKDLDYKHLLQQNRINYADGIGMKIASRIFGNPLVDNVNGTDLFPPLCGVLEAADKAIFFLGAHPHVVERVVRNTETNYPKLTIAGYHTGYFPLEETQRVLDQINQAHPDVLLVAMGVPLQEKWIHKHRNELQVPVMMGVGGLFNFYSGVIPRAPLWMRRMGLEWLHRLVQEPLRLWRRYLIGNVSFLLYTLYRKWIRK